METPPKEYIDMETKVDYLTLKGFAEGAIEAGESQKERLDEVTNRVGALEFHRPTDGTIVCTCIDGRCDTRGDSSDWERGLLPNTAGGTESLMVADDLTDKAFMLEGDDTTAGQYRQLLQYIKGINHPIGGHTAVDTHGAPSGCGANDKLPAIYAFIARKADQLKELTESLGYTVDDDTHALIVGNAVKRTEFSTGDELLQGLTSHGGSESVDVLRGAHKEVVAVINRRVGTTLDRQAVEREFGADYQSFNIDEWAFAESARLISHTGGTAEQNRKIVAMLYYNLATAGVLCGENMRVVVAK